MGLSMTAVSIDTITYRYPHIMDIVTNYPPSCKVEQR